MLSGRNHAISNVPTSHQKTGMHWSSMVISRHNLRKRLPQRRRPPSCLLSIRGCAEIYDPASKITSIDKVDLAHGTADNHVFCFNLPLRLHQRYRLTGRLAETAMPLMKYFGFVGTALVILLFGMSWCFPQPVSEPVRSGVDRPVIRINSVEKPPDRVHIDTSLPTIVPPPNVMEPDAG